MGIFVAVRKIQVRLGETRRKTNTSRYRFAAEAMGGIKSLKLDQLEEDFVHRYKEKSYEYSRVQATNAVISLTPRYFLEVMGFGAVLLILLYELRLEGVASNTIPIVGLYAFAGFRLLPKMQAMFRAGSSIRFTATILEELRKDLVLLKSSEEPTPADTPPVHNSFGLQDVTFSYPGASEPTLKNITLEIEKRTSVAFVGATGSGKTTCVDILLGLIVPQQGDLLVDGDPLSPGEVVGWRGQCGYVPQQIFLIDDTVACNIAFGKTPDKIDMDAVHRAARIAQIDSFIEAELPEGYQTIVGERGVRLSGGQRQRIGIARALYNNPEVLVFDEATSALDNVTERAIIHEINELSSDKTLVMIAHRLDTVRKCDKIFVIEAGQLVDSGAWEELASRCQAFQALIEASS